MDLLTLLARAALIAPLTALLPATSHAQTLGPESGMSLPRFVSMRYDEVNLRRGPSEDHQIILIYKRAGLPVEVLGEYRDWRRVRDFEGDTGWIKRTQLSENRTAMVLAGPTPLRRTPAADGRIQARLARGLVLELQNCPDQWCKIEVLGYRGYVHRPALWGLHKGERFEGQ